MFVLCVCTRACVCVCVCVFYWLFMPKHSSICKLSFVLDHNAVVSDMSLIVHCFLYCAQTRLIFGMYVVLCFTETNEVDVVPNIWVQKNGAEACCWWPPYKTSKCLMKAKIASEMSADGWSSFPIRIMYGPTSWLITC